MKNRIVSAVAALISGGLIALGPQYLFRLCGLIPGGAIMRCHWSGQAEIGIGALIAVLGIFLIISRNPAYRAAYSVSVALLGVLALLIPNFLIGGCSHPEMACRTTAFPALTVISLLVILFFTGNALYLRYRKKGR
ncbi:MAG: DUF4418 family protein [Deferribacteraceae bacterium]|jgi:hypothetical protein|nr:DUF4418 family protein [Deferribacteraceae bacterium]